MACQTDHSVQHSFSLPQRVDNPGGVACIYIYMVPPPEDLCFLLFSALSTRHHLRIVTQITHRKHRHTLSKTLFRLKPIEPIEISIGAKIQDCPGVCPRESWILDLGPD